MDTLTSVLTLAKLEAGQTDIELTALTVADEVRSVAEMHQVRAAEKGLTLEVEIASEAEEAKARLDPGALTSIVQNLVSNAIKFTEEGGVTVAVDVTGSTLATSEVQIIVEDTGVGMSDAFLPQLFQAFRREEKKAEHSREGAGMGLALVKRLVDLMGGTVAVESEKGVGSRFTVSFPLLHGASPSASVEDSTSTEASDARDRPTGQRILVIEDNQDTLFFVKTLLEVDYDLDTATTGEEALEMVREGEQDGAATHDLVLTDINLGPGLSGTDVLRELRQEPAYQDVPFMVFTAYALPGDRGEFLHAGFDGYLAKPFTADELLDELAQLL
jgi:CheY-like chemotaxis protein/anti-sigma regulatory factor (Ser/Thr protein kinase)